MKRPCSGLVDVFFSELADDIERARSICRRCGNRIRCAADAMRRGEEDGVWGGMTAQELQHLAEQTGAPAGGRAGVDVDGGTAALPRVCGP